MPSIHDAQRTAIDHAVMAANHRQWRSHCTQRYPFHLSMQPQPPANTTPRQTPALFWWLVLGSAALALLPTVWTALDLYAAGWFIGSSPRLHAVDWWWVKLINAYVPAVFRVLVFLALIGWLVTTLGRHGKRWRFALAFIALAVTLGPGLVVNMGFKDNWQRARPYQVEHFGGTQQFTRAAVMTDQCSANCSFVSGHVACGFFLASLMLIDKRRKVVWAVVGMSSGLTIGFARMADGAHWLSDVLWASPITLLCSWLVWRLLALACTSKLAPSST